MQICVNSNKMEITCSLPLVGRFPQMRFEV